MPRVDLHGAEIHRLDEPITPIEITDESVVGLVGAATDAEAGVAARLAIGNGNAGLVITAKQANTGGNLITVTFTNPGVASRPLVASRDGNDITVSLATDNASALTSTAADVAAAIAAAAPALVDVVAGGDGSGVVVAAAKTNLAGALDAIPQDRPMLITPANAHRLGAAGNLPGAIVDVWRAAGRRPPGIVAVRTADDTPAMVAGTRAGKTGAYALLDAESVVGVTPRLLATSISNAAAGLAIQAVGDEIGAMAVVELDGATRAEAEAARAVYSSAYCLWPQLVVPDAVTGADTTRPAAPIVVGHIARTDGLRGGPARSPSNHQVQGARRTAIAIDWSLSGRLTTANLLNRSNIATFVRRKGSLHLWGNRTANGALVPHERIQVLVGEALLDFIADYVDRNVDAPFVGFILRQLESFFRLQKLRGRIFGGRAWFPIAENPGERLRAGKVTFAFDLTLLPVAEQFQFNQQVTDIDPQLLLQEAA